MFQSSRKFGSQFITFPAFVYNIFRKSLPITAILVEFVPAKQKQFLRLKERLLNNLKAERAKTCRLEEIIERTNGESAADNEKHFKQGFYVAKNLVSMKEEGTLEL